MDAIFVGIIFLGNLLSALAGWMARGIYESQRK